MALTTDIKMGTILKVSADLKAGYIQPAVDGPHVYFDFDDVVKNIGLGIALEDYTAQYIEEKDNTGKLVAKQVTVLPGKPRLPAT